MKGLQGRGEREVRPLPYERVERQVNCYIIAFVLEGLT